MVPKHASGVVVKGEGRGVPIQRTITRPNQGSLRTHILVVPYLDSVVQCFRQALSLAEFLRGMK